MVWRALFLVLFAFGVSWVFYLDFVFRGASRARNEETGQIWPINDHGTTKYVVEQHYQIAEAAPVVNVCAFILILMLVLWQLSGRLRRN